MRQEMSEAMRNGQLLADAFGIEGADSDEERARRKALRVMTLKGELPMYLCNINVQRDESGEDSSSETYSDDQ